MEIPEYTSTYNLRKQIDKSFRIIVKNQNIELKAIKNNLYIIKNSYLSVKNSLKYIKKLPVNEYNQIRIFSIANIFYNINKNSTEIEELLEYLKTISESVNFNNDEIALLPEIFKGVLLINTAKELSKPNNNDFINNISVVMESLRTLNTYVFEDLYEQLSRSETVLNKDETYRNSDKKSKNQYRYKISQLSKKFKKEEIDIINELLSKAQRITHGKKSTIGYYLFKKPNIKVFYFPLLIIFTVSIQAAIYYFTDSVFSVFLTLLPSYIFSKQFTDLCFSIFKAQYVTRLKSDTVPKTLVTIITFINKEKDIDTLCEKCIQYMYSNNTEGLYFGFLADLPESTSPLTPLDRSLAEYSEVKIKELNQKYGNRFFCAIREKSLNNEDGLYKGRERKRGAVADLLNSIENSTNKNFIKLFGDVYNAKYFVSLDSDTLPGINSIKELISVLENPLHEHEINFEGTSVSNGYAIAVPRLENELESSMKNLFTKIFTGRSGSEIYSYPSFNVYQDIFEDAIFAGKGAININVFNKVLHHTLDSGTVLSHDIIEGLFLRTIYVSDVVFYDKSPSNIFSYLNRMDRWIRGDWQNIKYILPQIKKSDGQKIDNPFTFSGKFKIADNVFRSLTYTSIYSLLFFGIITNNIILLLYAILFLFKDTLIFLVKSCFNPIRFIPLYHRSGSFPALTQNILHSLSLLLLLPSLSFCEVKAIIKAIYRQIIKKKLLEWTTSEQTEKKTSEKQKILRKMIIQLSGLFFCFKPTGIPIAILWIMGIPFSTMISAEKNRKIHDNESNQVLRDMWKYFEDFLNEKNNYLPPDNYQDNPLIGCAERTSPTNMGLTLLSILGAYDMSFINEEKCLEMINNTLTTIESLEKYQGHLLNWYDITSKRPLHPKYISTVDNGNFICCLHTLRNALKDFSLYKAMDIAERIDKIIKNTNFLLLFNKHRKLFHIGYEVENHKLSNSFYDLYASESRLTSFYAIASGQIPPEHWSQLGRPITINSGTIGIKSWSGTAFEYLMPHLLLPVKEGSFADEIIRFSIDTQINSVKKRLSYFENSTLDIPWGISESCYYSLGTDLAYQYKAFGSGALAINEYNLPYNEIIISPYSTFLSMPFEYKKSVKNLNLLSLYDLRGKYGYYESIDFHKSSDKYIPQIISTFMVHHIGMSFISLLNIKKDNIMQKRFMDKQMSAFSLLLEENIPIINTIPFANFKFKQEIPKYENKPTTITPNDTENQQYKSYSDGETCLLVSDCGNSYLKYKNLDIIYNDKNDFNGIFAFFKTGKRVYPFSFNPLKDSSLIYKTIFHEGFAEYDVKAKSINLKQNITVIQGKACELREYIIKNNTNSDINGEILIYLEPILQKYDNYKMHPIFSKLFIESEFDKNSNTLYITRRNRNDGHPENFMSLHFDINNKYSFELSRFNVIETNKGKSSIINAFNTEFSNCDFGPVDPCIALKMKISVKAKDEYRIKMYIHFENSKTKLLKNRLQLEEKKYSFNKIASDTAYYSINIKDKHNFDIKDIKIAEYILNTLYSHHKLQTSTAIQKNTLGIENLWKFGISGNNPIITIKIHEDTYKNCESFIKAFAYIKSQNVSCELVLCFVDNGSYDRKIRTRIIESIMNTELTSLIDKPNGIFLINLTDINIYSLLNSVSVLTIDTSDNYKPPKATQKITRDKQYNVEPIKVDYKLKTGIGGFTENGFAIDDKIKFTHKPPWSIVLANKSFGTIMSDNSLGYTYAFNSYKNKITPWENDITKDNGGESLYIILNKGNEKRIYNIIKDSTAFFNEKYAEYSSTIENIFIKVKVFIPIKLKVKIIQVKIENPNKEYIKLKYSPTIIMNDRKYENTVSKTRIDNTLLFTNPFNSEFKDGTVYLKGFNMKPEGNSLSGLVQSENTNEFIIFMGYEKNFLAAKKAAGLLNKERMKTEEKTLLESVNYDIKIKTPSKELDLFYNSFLQCQIINCRLLAKSGFYQCGGAYGFRDQLQDSLCIATLDSKYLKDQILICTQMQFEEGDVLHWFHEKRDNKHKGVRSKSSDDLLWLPYAICEYIEKTQDFNLLDIKRHYIKGEILTETEKEKYIEAETSSISESIYEHAKRAITKAITKGKHGLVLFGSGDWNDGLNEIGNGETVWGTFFLIIVLEKFANLCEYLGDKDFEAFCKKTAEDYRDSINLSAWDTDRFIRGYFEDGTKFGCEDSPECKIDLISQAFAAICGNFDKDKTITAIESAKNILVDKENKIIKLFTPPFNKTKNNPGYIMGYIPGIRENGGQYTHASLWFVLALLRIKDYNTAFEILEMINPINHCKTLYDIKKYRNEPYVLSADIYTNPAHYGMGGWSWYTGSAGWFFKIVTEEILGIQQFGKELFMRPQIPDSWNDFEVTIKKDGKTISIKVIRSAELSESENLYVDGLKTFSIPLNGKDHNVIYYI